MASANVLRSDSFLSQVERVRMEITTKFQRSHQVLVERKATILSELDELVVRYKGEEVNQQIEELNRLKETQLSSVKENENKEFVNQSVLMYETRIKEIRAKFERDLASMRIVVLKWDECVFDKLSEIGSIEVSDLPTYEEKGDPIVVACKHSYSNSTSPGVFYFPGSIAIDSETDNVYICDSMNHRVQVFTKNLEFLFDFKEEMYWPQGICINHSKVYVTQYMSYSLNVYSTEGKFLNSVGKRGKGKPEFDWPRGVAVSNEKKIIYICDSGNDIIQCLNLDLTFHSFIEDIPSPRDVKLTSDEVVVLASEDLCVTFYNYSHQHIRQIIPRGKGNLVINPWYFCVDKASNILMTDYATNCVLIFSNRGELIHKFGQRGEDRGEFIDVKGIALDSEDRIIVVSKNPNHCIQLF